MKIVNFLSSGVARQRRIAHDDLSGLLFYRFSNLRFYKQNNANVKVYKRCFQILDVNFFINTPNKMKFSINFAPMLNLVRQIKSSFNSNPSLELPDITHA